MDATQNHLEAQLIERERELERLIDEIHVMRGFLAVRSELEGGRLLSLLEIYDTSVGD